MPLLAGCKPVGLRWVYKNKQNVLGQVVRYRVRLVAKGFQQTFGVNYFDTYSPVAKLSRLKKSLYGLKQCLKSWNDTLNEFLSKSCDLRRLQSESCLYVRTDRNTTKCIIVATYVDDIVIAYNDTSLYNRFKSKMMFRFQCKNH